MLPVRDARRCLVRNNTIEDNNRANFAPRGTIVASVPVGIGVLVMAADETEVRGNTIRRNNGTGVGAPGQRQASTITAIGVCCAASSAVSLWRVFCKASRALTK